MNVCCRTCKHYWNRFGAVERCKHPSGRREYKDRVSGITNVNFPSCELNSSGGSACGVDAKLYEAKTSIIDRFHQWIR